MGEENKERPSSGAPTAPQGALPVRVSIGYVALAICLAAVVGGTLYYASRVTNATAFNDDRAFRVLGETATQLTNLLSTRAALLHSMPEPLEGALHWCKPVQEASLQHSTTDSRSTIEAELLESYESRLDLFSPTLCKSARTEVPAHSGRMLELDETVADACASSHKDGVVFRLDTRERKLLTALCGSKMTPDSSEKNFAIQENFDQVAQAFLDQDFFLETLLVSADGQVIAELPRRESSGNPVRVPLHPPVAEKLSVLDAHRLLWPPGGIPGDTKSPVAQEQEAGVEPRAFNLDIAQHPYRIFVRPFSVGNLITVSSTTDAAKPVAGANAADAAKTGDAARSADEAKTAGHAFYVVGIESNSLKTQIMFALWPEGLWAVTLALLLALLAIPLLTLAFGSSEEPIPRYRAVLALYALLFIPAILSVGAASLWGQLELSSWMRHSAQEYADAIEGRLHASLLDGADILAGYLPDFAGESNKSCKKLVDDLKTRSGRSNVQPDSAKRGRPSAHNAPQSVLLEPCRTVERGGAEGASIWSPIRTVIALDDKGDRVGHVYTAFRPSPSKAAINLSPREYFQSLKHSQGWLVHGDGQRESCLVAQRLFNKTDATKTLQIAIPVVAMEEGGGARIDAAACRAKDSPDPPDGHAVQPPAHSTTGAPILRKIITGDLRLHSLIAGTSPPLLQFAVVDDESGTVLFHSDDSRSLAQSFFRESEQNPELASAIESHHAAFFTGNYLGVPHEFYYEPLRDIPWGVVTFYSLKEMDDLPFHAGSAALAAYAVAVLLSSILLVALRFFVVALFGRQPRILELLWPRTPLRPIYRWVTRFRPSFLATTAFLALLIYGPAPGAWLALIVLALFMVLGYASRAQSRRIAAKGQADAHAEWVSCLLFVAAVLPAFFLFRFFHQQELNGLIRDGLLHIGYQLQQRHDRIAADLEHWLPPHPKARYPDAWELTFHPDRGMMDVHSEWEQGDQEWRGVAQVEGVDPAAVDGISSLLWGVAGESPEQRRRLSLLSGPAMDHAIQCATRPTGVGSTKPKGVASFENCWIRLSDEKIVWLSAPSAKSGYLQDPRGSTDEHPTPRQADLNEADRVSRFGARILVVVSFLGVWLASFGIARLLAYRLFGLDKRYTSRKAYTPAAGDEPPTRETFKATVWNRISPAARLLLYQLASRRIPNPRADAAIDELLERRLVHLDPWPKVRWPKKVEPLILHAQTTDEFHAWERNATRGLWRTLRPILFIALMVLIAVLSWAAGGSMRALSAILVATAAFLGQLSQLAGFIRGGLSSPPKS
jgi:hypothetical protein